MDQERFKPSAYNFFVPSDDGGYLAFNAFSNSLAKVTKEKYDIIRFILEDPNRFELFNDEADKLRTDLIRGSFLVEEDFDEINYLKMRNRMGRFAGDSLGLTIAPTLACNFNCAYCFEEKKQDSMNETVEKALIGFVEERLKRVKELHVSWFGGEPTLKLDIIERLTESFESLCEKNNVLFPDRGIITNGYLLDRETALRLKRLKVTGAQITLDGPPEIHDKRRPLNGGQGTFNRILSNIRECCDILRIHVRVNLDRDNASSVQELLDLFVQSDLAGKVSVYFGQVKSNTAACADMAAMCFNNEEHSRRVAEILTNPRNRGVAMIRYPNAQHWGFCSADRVNGLVIAPNGFIFKCWCELGDNESQSVGSILESTVKSFQLNNLARYLNWNHFDNPDCLACRLLPVCSGGCPYNAMRSPDNKDCSEFKYNIDDMLLLNCLKFKPK